MKTFIDKTDEINGFFDAEEGFYFAESEMERTDKEIQHLKSTLKRTKKEEKRNKIGLEIDRREEYIVRLQNIMDNSAEDGEEEESEKEKWSKYKEMKLKELEETSITFEREPGKVIPGKIELPEWSLPTEEIKPQAGNIVVNDRVTIQPPAGNPIIREKTIKIPVKGKNLNKVISTIEKGIEKVFNFFGKLFK